MKKVQKFSSLKDVGTNIWPGICYLLNGWGKILLEYQPAARLKNFQLTVRKIC